MSIADYKLNYSDERSSANSTGLDPVRVTGWGECTCNISVDRLVHDHSVTFEIKREGKVTPIISRLLKRIRLLENQGKRGVPVLKNRAGEPLNQEEILNELEDAEDRLKIATKIAKNRGEPVITKLPRKSSS